MSARDKLAERARMKVLFQVPFFAPAVAKLPIVWDANTQTASTDGECIKWNPEWFDKLEEQVRVTVLCHEAMHCMLGHLWRVPAAVQGADGWRLWNEATDHAVNLQLDQFAQAVVGKKLANPFPFPQPESDYCKDPQYAGLAEEQIFARLNRPGGKGSGGGKPGGSGKGAGKGRPSFGEMERPQGQSADPAKQKQLANDWDGTLIQACHIARGRGELPAGMERIVRDLVSNKVPWWEVLRSWLREQAADDWNFLKPAVEFEASGFILPSLDGEKIGRVVFATDTSGSIDHELLSVFQGEKQTCLDEMKPRSVVDIYCDAQIHAVREYSPGDTMKRDCPGGGGTNFRPVFDHCAKMPEAPKALVYLTDLDGTFPKEDPGYPVLWVTWTKDGKAPFGEVIYAGD
jgi:predicted metal-dependent peptidase